MLPPRLNTIPRALLLVTAVLMLSVSATGWCLPERVGPPRVLTDEGILWNDANHQEALFIPEALLNTAPLSELPLRDADRRALETTLKSDSPAPMMIGGRMTPDCALTDEHSGIGEPSPEAVHLSEFLRSSRVLFVGRVVNVFLGWNAPYRHVSSMVEVRVEEVLHAYRGWPRVGSLVFYEQRHGEFYVGDHRLCDLTVSGRDSFRAVRGQRILVTGIDHDLNPKLVLGAIAWPVSSRGDVVPQPYRAVLPELVSLTTAPVVSQLAPPRAPPQMARRGERSTAHRSIVV